MPDNPGPDQTPETTIVIPVWDDYVSERLGDALASVRGQDRPAHIVVVDNASEVPLPPLPGAWVLRAPQRLSLGSARNLGLQRVSTPYVVFWDADDVMLEGTLSLLEDAISTDPTVVAFATAVVEDPSRKRHRWPRSWVSRLVRAPRVFAVLDSIWSLYPSTGATIMRTDAVRAAGGYGDSNAGEDWCLGVSLAYRGHIGWSERPGRLYRVHPGSTWAQHMSPDHLVTHATLVRQRIEADPGIPEWARKALPAIYVGQQAAIGAHVALERIRQLAEHERIRQVKAAAARVRATTVRGRGALERRRARGRVGRRS